MSKKKLTYKDFLNYFGNNLQNKDKHAFEKDMMRDAFEEEAFDGLSQLSKDELENDMAELKAGIIDRTKSRKRVIPIWFRYAASVIVLIGIGVTIVYLNSNYWKDSMLKDQVSHEMELADSMVNDADKTVRETAQKMDSVKEKPEQLIADGKQIKLKKEEKAKAKQVIVDDEIELDDAYVLEAKTETDKDEVLDIIEFEEEEEVPEEIFMIVEPKAQAHAAEEIEKTDFKEEKVLEDVEISNALQGEVAGVRVKESKGEARLAKNSSNIIEETEKTATIIKGKIVSVEDDLSVPGVSVTLKGNPKIGTTTNKDGEFQLTLPDNDEELKTLIASFVGMKSQEIEVDQDTNLLVYMETDVLAMDEVIVTGYGKSSGPSEAPVKISAKPPHSVSKNKFEKQILEKLDYSKLSDFSGKYRVKVFFTVSENGSLSDFNCRNIPDIVFCNEIRRVIKEMGEWIPATENDTKVSSTVKLTLKIEIE